MKPEWDKLALDEEAVTALKTEYERAEAQLTKFQTAGDEDGVAAMQKVLTRIEAQAISGAVGDQPDDDVD